MGKNTPKCRYYVVKFKKMSFFCIFFLFSIFFLFLQWMGVSFTIRTAPPKQYKKLRGPKSLINLNYPEWLLC